MHGAYPVSLRRLQPPRSGSQRGRVAFLLFVQCGPRSTLRRPPSRVKTHLASGSCRCDSGSPQTERSGRDRTQGSGAGERGYVTDRVTGRRTDTPLLRLDQEGFRAPYRPSTCVTGNRT